AKLALRSLGRRNSAGRKARFPAAPCTKPTGDRALPLGEFLCLRAKSAALRPGTLSRRGGIRGDRAARDVRGTADGAAACAARRRSRSVPDGPEESARGAEPRDRGGGGDRRRGRRA